MVFLQCAHVKLYRFSFIILGSSPNVRQRAPIAKNLPSQSDLIGGDTLKGSNFDMPRMHSSQGQQPSPQRGLLSSPNNSNQSDIGENFSQDRSSNLFRSQKGGYNKFYSSKLNFKCSVIKP